MTQEDFIKEVKTFQNIYFEEYLKDIQITFGEDFEAEITAKDMYGNNYAIPITVDADGFLAIDTLDGDVYLPASGEGFYCFLWHEVLKTERKGGR